MTTTPLGAQWLGSPNFSAGRDGHSMAIPPAYVVMHTMVGTIGSANSRFQQASQQASATYGVGLNGSIVQWVDEDNAAWANGTYDRNPGSNLDSISIEHEDGGDYNGPRTPELYHTSALLVRDICNRYNIPINRQFVLKHSEVSINPTACPDALDVDRIVALAASGGNDLLDPSDGVVKEIRNTLTRLAGATFDGNDEYAVFDANGNVTGVKIVTGNLRFMPDMLRDLQSRLGAVQQQLTALSGTEGQAGAILTQLSAATSAMKSELDNVAASQAGGTPADLSELMAAVSTVDSHVKTLSTHLGVS
jgi:N-acetylmuramoyl-L-alanine amidase